MDGESIRPDIESKKIPLCPSCRDIDYINQEDIPDPIMKPDITFFGEALPKHFEVSLDADAAQIDLLVVIGTSLKVEPVSSVVNFFPHNVPVICINRELIYHAHHSFDIMLLGYCDVVVGELMRRLGWTGDEKYDGRDVSSNNCNGDSFFQPQHLPPNVWLFEGAHWDADRYSRLLRQDRGCISSDDESMDGS